MIDGLVDQFGYVLITADRAALSYQAPPSKGAAAAAIAVMGGGASTLLSPKKPRGTLGYLSVSELSHVDQRARCVRSAEWAKKELFRSLPLNVKGLKPPRNFKQINPEMILSIDSRKFFQQAGAGNDGDPAARAPDLRPARFGRHQAER